MSNEREKVWGTIEGNEKRNNRKQEFNETSNMQYHILLCSLVTSRLRYHLVIRVWLDVSDAIDVSESSLYNVRRKQSSI